MNGGRFLPICSTGFASAYYLFVVAFPLLAFTAHLTVVLKTDSVHPANAMHCDNTSPVKMHAELRQLRAQEAQQSQGIRRFSFGCVSSIGCITK